MPADHRLAQQEVFGPVLAAMPFDEDHAVELANATPALAWWPGWTRDGARQLRMARRVASGQVFINNYGAGGGVERPWRRQVQQPRAREEASGAVRVHHPEDRGHTPWLMADCSFKPFFMPLSPPPPRHHRQRIRRVN